MDGNKLIVHINPSCLVCLLLIYGIAGYQHLQCMENAYVGGIRISEVQNSEVPLYNICLFSGSVSPQRTCELLINGLKEKLAIAFVEWLNSSHPLISRENLRPGHALTYMMHTHTTSLEKYHTICIIS